VRTVRRVLGRTSVLVVAIVSVVALSTGTLVAAEVDRRAAHTLPAGTFVGRVDVSGLSFTAAVARVDDRLVAPLRAPLHVEADGFSEDTSAWDLGYRLDARAVVRQALDRSRRPWLVTRIWRRMSGPSQVVVRARPHWVPGLAAGLVARAQHAVALDPVPARVDASSGWVQVLPDQAGRVLDADAAKRALAGAVERGLTTVTLPSSPTVAEVRAGALTTVILVRTGENMLYLYQDGQIVKSYPVATGTGRYPTPTGLWRLERKLLNPVWTNPNSDWSTHMPARIGPGPTNPLGTHALALNAEGILIHATPDVGSIGFSASHGCVRMAPADEEDLFGRVGVGTPVAIVTAGPPKPRVATPAPAAPQPLQPTPPVPVVTPAQDAAVHF
jgi:lipoprotein-anchoring transpeptidase ErfK/SrfK